MVAPQSAIERGNRPTLALHPLPCLTLYNGGYRE